MCILPYYLRTQLHNAINCLICVITPKKCVCYLSSDLWSGISFQLSYCSQQVLTPPTQVEQRTDMTLVFSQCASTQPELLENWKRQLKYWDRSHHGDNKHLGSQASLGPQSSPFKGSLAFRKQCAEGNRLFYPISVGWSNLVSLLGGADMDDMVSHTSKDSKCPTKMRAVLFHNRVSEWDINFWVLTKRVENSTPSCITHLVTPASIRQVRLELLVQLLWDIPWSLTGLLQSVTFLCGPLCGGSLSQFCSYVCSSWSFCINTLLAVEMSNLNFI